MKNIVCGQTLGTRSAVYLWAIVVIGASLFVFVRLPSGLELQYGR